MTSTETAVRLISFRPTRPWFSPGSPAGFVVELETDRTLPLRAELAVHDLDRVVAVTGAKWTLSAGPSRRGLRVRLPMLAASGYSARLGVRSLGGELLISAEAPIEALEGWWQSPRHACLTEFAPGYDPRRAVRRLADWNVNVVQFYDWMYRHYRYRPPRGAVFTDVLGRAVSHAVVRDAIKVCHEAGIAALAYGSVYGAEREYAERHPEQVVVRRGRPVSLGGTFFITDLRRQSAWRERLLEEYEAACRDFGFDGIHMDQYGRQYRGGAADGSRLDFPRLFLDLINQADRRVRATEPTRRVLFNAVGGWPLEATASSASAATYVELWPPDTRYRDVVRVIDEARRRGPGKAIVIAAYLSAFAKAARGAERRRALEGALLLGSIVVASGAHWHGIADGDRLLVDGYYPLAQPLTDREAGELQQVWRFSARYHHLLHGPSLKPVAPPDISLVGAGGERVPTSDRPQAGMLWLRAVRGAGSTILHLVDLRAQATDSWDAPKTRTPVVRGTTATLKGAPGGLLFGSPWHGAGLVQRVEGTHPDGGQSFRLPPFRRWAMLVLPHAR